MLSSLYFTAKVRRWTSKPVWTWWRQSFPSVKECSTNTPWRWSLLERRSVVQPLGSFPVFYGNRRFVTAFTRALHLYLSWAKPIQSTPPSPISIRSILMLSTHPRPRFTNMQYKIRLTILHLLQRTEVSDMKMDPMYMPRMFSNLPITYFLGAEYYEWITGRNFVVWRS
jgi:hypothetical protein